MLAMLLKVKLEKIDKLKELKQLLDDGIVDENEFNKLKDEIING